MSTNARLPRAKAAPVLVLCRQCVRYVFEGTIVCPHCHGNTREMSERYRDEGYLGIETMLRIDRLRDAAEEDRASRDQ
jgi:uncharacterized OB-fold protein